MTAKITSCMGHYACRIIGRFKEISMVAYVHPQASRFLKVPQRSMTFFSFFDSCHQRKNDTSVSLFWQQFQDERDFALEFKLSISEDETR